jgi:hypothetical protein
VLLFIKVYYAFMIKIRPCVHIQVLATYLTSNARERRRLKMRLPELFSRAAANEDVDSAKIKQLMRVGRGSGCLQTLVRGAGAGARRRPGRSSCGWAVAQGPAFIKS